tara:strand:+ start:53007 stop:53354 length:348 start_codon:yes stop_codon:yes gene_type:complete
VSPAKIRFSQRKHKRGHWAAAVTAFGGEKALQIYQSIGLSDLYLFAAGHPALAQLASGAPANNPQCEAHPWRKDRLRTSDRCLRKPRNSISQFRIEGCARLGYQVRALALRRKHP